MEWIRLIPVILVAIGIIVLPGLIVVNFLRIPIVPRIALAGVAGVAVIGAAGILGSLVGLGYAPWQPIVLAVAIGAIVWALDRARPVVIQRDHGRAVFPILAIAASGALIAVVAFAFVPSPRLVSQTYDNVFHMSAIASILATGDASSLTLRTIIETDSSFGYYPAAWHTIAASVVQITGTTPMAAVNASWIAVCAVIWVPGAMWFAQCALRRSPSRTVGFVAAALAAAFGGMPYVLLSWGTLYPTFLATALLPAAGAIPLAWWRAHRATKGRARWAAAGWAAAAFATALAAVAFSQPRVVVTLALLLAPFGLGLAIGEYRRAAARGGASLRRARAALWSSLGVAVIVAAVGFAYVVFRLGLFERPLDDRLGGPQAAATQSVVAGLAQVATMSWPTGVDSVVVAGSLALAALVVVGAIAAARTPGLRWVVVSFAAVAILFALAAGSDDVVTKLATALWYKDRYRLLSALPIPAIVLASLGAVVASTWFGARTGRRRRALAVWIAWGVALLSAATLVVGGLSSSIAAVFRMPATAAQDEVVSAEQSRFMAEISTIVPEGQRVLGDPWDGSAWTWVFGDREPVFPHVNGQWDADRRALAWRLDQVETNAEICDALDRLGVRYVLYSPHDLGSGDAAGNHFPGPHRAVEAGLFEEVAAAGDTRLYRIDQCGPLA